MPKNKLINLIPQAEFDSSIIGRTLRWALGTFRIIVIVTEMIVMAAFFSRFWLDAQNSDLTDSIKIKSAQIVAQSSFEKQFKDIQSKLSIFKSIAALAKPTDNIEEISSTIPPDITLTTINIDDQVINIKGYSISEVGISQLVANLKAKKTFKKVELGQINISENNQSLINFSIKITK